MELQQKNIIEAFDAVRAWADEAHTRSEGDNYSSIDQLRYVLDQPNHSILGVEERLSVNGNQSLVGFQIVGDPNVGTKTRYVLPIHFAIMRLFELVPGIILRLQDDAHRSVYARKGIHRTDDDLIFSLGIRLAASLAKEFGLPKRSRLDRILFNAPPDATLNPRRTNSYRHVVPSGSVLIRARQTHAQTQETWLKAVQGSLKKSKQDELRELPSTLKLLFMTADRWHWKELIDRLEDDPRLSA